MARLWNNADTWNTAEPWSGASIYAGPRDPLPRVLVEIDGPSGPLWFADGRYLDASAGVVAHARIGRRISFERRVSTAYWGGGRTFQGVGSVELINTDGGLDWMLALQLRDRVARVWLGNEDTPIASLTLCARAIVERVDAAGEQAIRVVLADASRELGVPVQEATFATGPLAGQPVPITVGYCLSIPAVQPEAPLLRFAVHDAIGAGGALAVTDSGVTLTPTTQWVDYNTSPTFGVLLNQATSGRILVDMLGPGDGIGGEKAQLPSVIAYLLGTRLGWSASRWDATALAALSVELGEPEFGRWCSAPIIYSQLLDELADSFGGWWTVDPDGVMRMDALRLPAGSPALVVDRSRIGGEVSVDFDAAQGLSSIVSGRRNWYPLPPSEQAGSVRDTAAGVALAQDYRERAAFAVGTVYARSAAAAGASRDRGQSAGMPTLLANTASTAAEAARREPLFASARWFYRIPALLDATDAATIPLGTVIELRLPRFGADAGRLLRVVGVRGEVGSRNVELTCWGAGPEIEE